MLAIKHKAPHLSKMKAYAEYCWSVDAYGSYQPASFIYLSFDSFSQLCQKHGVKLYEADECPDMYYGLITRIESLETANEIQSALLDGKNVIALYPNEMIGLYYGRSKELVQKAIEGAEKLGVSNPEIKITGAPVSDLSKISWEEIQTGYSGRLFVTTDSFLSDGFFMPKYESVA